MVPRLITPRHGRRPAGTAGAAGTEPSRASTTVHASCSTQLAADYSVYTMDFLKVEQPATNRSALPSLGHPGQSDRCPQPHSKTAGRLPPIREGDANGNDRPTGAPRADQGLKAILSRHKHHFAASVLQRSIVCFQHKKSCAGMSPLQFNFRGPGLARSDSGDDNFVAGGIGVARRSNLPATNKWTKGPPFPRRRGGNFS